MISRARGLLRGLAGARESGLVIAVAAVVAVIACRGDAAVFFGRTNQANMLRQIGLLGVFAVGEAVVIIAGGIDLSVGSVIAFTGMVCALVVTSLSAGQPGADVATVVVLAGLVTAVGVGLAVGLFHALCITRLGLPPFIATLGTLAGLRSAAELITGSVPVTCAYPSFRFLGTGQTPLYLFIITAAAVATLMRRSALGRQIVALGGNEEAARLSGLKVDRLKAVAYGLSGGLAGLAGMMHAAYIGQGDPRAGVAYELQAIAAVVVGGCSLTGGVGTIAGVVLGVILLQVTLNGIFLVVEQNSTQWQGLVVGVVVILAVALNAARERRRG